MNISVYVLEDLSVGYMQYPTDYTTPIFKESLKFATSASQIIVHRDGQMMYYIYVRELHNKQKFGLCVVVNGLLLADFEQMFEIFENTIETLLVSGSILHLTKEGHLETESSLISCQENVFFLSEKLKSDFSKLESSAVSLPSVNYAVSSSEMRKFSIAEDCGVILQASHTYGYTVIQKDEDFESEDLRSYRGILSHLSKENKTLKESNAELHRKKENITKVMWLAVVLIILMLIGLFVYTQMSDSIANLQIRLNDANEMIDLKNDTISKQAEEINQYITNILLLSQDVASKENKINTQKSTINAQKDELAQKNGTIKSQKQQIATLENDKIILNKTNSSLQHTINEQEKIIKNTTRLALSNVSFNFNTGRLSFRYTSPYTQYQTLKIRVIRPDGSHKDYEKSITFKKGTNHQESCFITTRLKRSKYYTFNIYLNNDIIGGGRF